MRSKKKGYVYMIKDFLNDDLYKIGVTRGDIHKRLKKLQTGNGGELYIFSLYETDYPFFIEHNMHMKFFGQRELNEWFRIELPEALKFNEYCKEIEDRLEILKDNPFMKKYMK